MAVCYCEHIFQFITIPFPFYGDTIGFMMFFVLLGLCKHFFTVGTNTPCSGKRFKKWQHCRYGVFECCVPIKDIGHQMQQFNEKTLWVIYYAPYCCQIALLALSWHLPYLQLHQKSNFSQPVRWTHCICYILVCIYILVWLWFKTVWVHSCVSFQHPHFFHGTCSTVSMVTPNCTWVSVPHGGRVSWLISIQRNRQSKQVVLSRAVLG